MSNTHLWWSSSPITRDEMAAFALEQGLDLVGDPPWTGGVRQSTWAADEAQLTFAAHAPSGGGLVVVAAPRPELPEALCARFDLASPEEVMAAAEAAEGRPAVIAGLYAVGALLLATHREPVEEIAHLCRRLTDEDRHVRFGAARILRGWPRPEVVQAMEEAARSHPELRRLAQHLERQLEAVEAGIVDDHPTDDWGELIRRARAGLVEGKLARIERATDMLLDEALDHPEGLLLRAYFHAGSGQPVLALGLAGAAREAIADASDEREEGDTDDLVALAAEVQVIVGRVAGETAERDAAERVMSWLARFDEADRAGPLYGMAQALIETLEHHRPLLCFLAGRFDDDLERLGEAVMLAPDAPSARFARGRAWCGLAPDRAEAELREALRLLEGGGARSAAAEQIESFVESLRREEVLEVLTPLVYEQERWNEAGALADALVEANPGSAMGWQIRANARTFAGRHREAAELYRETLEALEAILDGDGMLFGQDPRPAMHFNRACVLSKIDARQEALEALRCAVVADAQWAERAVEDDYFGALLEDETFKRIVAREPRALVSAEALEEEAVADLVDRALGLNHQGDVDAALEIAETAAERARWGGHPELEVRALALRGRIVAVERDPGAGMEMVERAVASLASDTAEEVRIEAVHARGLVLQLNGRLDEAEAAYRHALELRRTRYGEAHPLLAKSLGDLANLATLQGDDEAGEPLWQEAVALLEAYLEGEDEASEGDDEELRVEARTDLAILRANLGRLALRRGHWAEAMGEATAATEAVEGLLRMGYQHGVAFMDSLAELLRDITRVAPDGASVRVATAVEMRVEGVGLDSRPTVREEQTFWRRLRRFVARLRREGVGEDVLADTFSQALRGPEQLPEALRALPELGGFAHALAQRAAAVPSFLVLAPMALETARADGRLDLALEQLEGLCLSYVIEGAEG